MAARFAIRAGDYHLAANALKASGQTHGDIGISPGSGHAPRAHRCDINQIVTGEIVEHCGLAGIVRVLCNRVAPLAPGTAVVERAAELGLARATATGFLPRAFDPPPFAPGTQLASLPPKETDFGLGFIQHYLQRFELDTIFRAAPRKEKEEKGKSGSSFRDSPFMVADAC